MIKQWNSKYEAKIDGHHFDIKIMMVTNWSRVAGTWLNYNAEVYWSQGSGDLRTRKALLCTVQSELKPNTKTLISVCKPNTKMKSIVESTAQARTLKELSLDAVREAIAKTANDVRKIVYAEHG